MTTLHVFPSKISGKLKIPPSKSHSFRALIFAMLGKGKTTISNILPSPDTENMLNAISQFGSKITRSNGCLEIQGGFYPSKKSINAGNSGLILRLIGAIATLLPSKTMIYGDHSICHQRPITPLLQALNQLGASAKSIRKNGYAPILLQGPIQPGHCQIEGEDSQFVSALLISLASLRGFSKIDVQNPGEKPFIDLTLHWLNRLGAEVENKDYRRYVIHKNLNYSGFNYDVPSDFSTAAFPLVAALITGSFLELEGLDKNDIQGDKILIDILSKIGAKICFNDTLKIHPSKDLIGRKIDINLCIDALPILAVLGCFINGVTEIFNGRIARKKECDRISAICHELKKMGANIEEKEDGYIVRKAPLHGANVDSHNDHRIALALFVAGLKAVGSTKISNAECIAKTYPNFANDFQKMGANIEYHTHRV